MKRSLFSLIACAALLGASMLCAASPAAAATTAAALSSFPSIGAGEIIAAGAALAAVGAAAVSPALQAEDDAAAAVAVAPRVTLEGIEAKIVREETHVFDDLLTVHVLTMANGFKITGESACASPENYNAELGVKIARDQAIRKAWGFEGYLLREQLHASG